MKKRLTLFYRISIWMIPIFFLTNISVKTIVWFSSSLVDLDNKTPSFIAAFDNTPWVKYRYTTKQKEKLFKTIDYLLPPAFSMLFILLAIKLVKTPEIFQEKD